MHADFLLLVFQNEQSGAIDIFSDVLQEFMDALYGSKVSSVAFARSKDLICRKLHRETEMCIVRPSIGDPTLPLLL